MKIIPYLSYILCIGSIFCSCQKNDLEDPGKIVSDSPISFNGQFSTGRATQTTKSTLASMGVICFYTAEKSYGKWDGNKAEPNFMSDQLIEKKNDAWSYSDPKYWPASKDDKLTFFAYSPYSSNTNGMSLTKGVTLKYSTPDNSENQPDLLVAEPILDKTKAIVETQDNKSINFTFSHVLSCISFKHEGSKQVKSITITGIATEGTYDISGTNKGWELTNDKTRIINCQIATGENGPYAMFLPQTLDSSVKVTVIYSDNSTKKTFLLSGEWVQGKRYEYTLKD